MAKRLTIDAPAWQVWKGAAALVLTGALLAVGVGFAGYFLGRGERAAPEAAPTALAERTYTSADLADAAAGCGVDTSDVSTSSITLLRDEYESKTKTCVMMALDPPARVLVAWDGVGFVSSGSDSRGDWGNLSAVWKSYPDSSRDLTVKIETT